MNRFIVGGYPKSGTTFLQMLLDAHPHINCHSEQYIKYLFTQLNHLSNEYDNYIRLIDERTARQGISFDRQLLFNNMARSALLTLMDNGMSEDITHSGFNDNSIARTALFIANIMPEIRFIFIVRDPRDITISLWHHKIRTEPEAADTALNDIVNNTLETWPANIASILQYCESHREHAMLVKYEDLVGDDRASTLSTLFAFLGAENNQHIISQVFDVTDFEKLKAKEQSGENNPRAEVRGFFRYGKSNSWKEALDESQLERFATTCAQELDIFNYT